jgi:hypothetical protein
MCWTRTAGPSSCSYICSPCRQDQLSPSPSATLFRVPLQRECANISNFLTSIRSSQAVAFHIRPYMEFCDICQCDVPGGGWDLHVRGKAHCRNASMRASTVLQSAHRDKNGISVSSQDSGLDFGVVEPGRVSQTSKSFTLKVTIDSAEFMVLDPQWTSSSSSVGAGTACVNF